MHFFKPFFLHFFLNFFGTLFWHSWALFLGTFSVFLYWTFLETFSGTPLSTFLWELTFIGTILSTLKSCRTILCTFLWPPFTSFCFFFTLLFSTLLKTFGGWMNFFWHHLRSSKKYLNFFQTSFRSFSYHFLGTLFSCQEQLNRWPTATAT